MTSCVWCGHGVYVTWSARNYFSWSAWRLRWEWRWSKIGWKLEFWPIVQCTASSNLASVRATMSMWFKSLHLNICYTQAKSHSTNWILTGDAYEMTRSRPTQKLEICLARYYYNAGPSHLKKKWCSCFCAKTCFIITMHTHEKMMKPSKQYYGEKIRLKNILEKAWFLRYFYRASLTGWAIAARVD